MPVNHPVLFNIGESQNVNFTYDKPKQSSGGQQYMMVRCRIAVPLSEKIKK